MSMNGVAALNVYKKVAIIRKSTDVLSYEDSEGNVKTVTDLHLEAAATVRLVLFICEGSAEFLNPSLHSIR
jgi:hypothetical protein